MTLEDKDFYRLRDYMYTHFGLNLAAKRTLIEGRLSTMVAQKGFNDFASYIDHMLADKTGAEVSLLVSKLTTNFTYFMREEVHYKFLTDVALPEWMPKIEDHDLRIWSAGCSSGEEPYTTAMVLDSYLGIKKSSWDTVVLASDISENVLSMARRGIYTSDRMANIPPSWRTRYFKKLDQDRYELTDAIKKQVVFRNINLMDQRFSYKKKYHVIFCRNVMIYFDSKTRQELANRFYEVLQPGGYLFIGMSESLVNLKTPFHYIQPAIYKK